MIDEQGVMDAAVAVLEAGQAHPHTLQSIKTLIGKLPNYYTEVTAGPRFGGEFRMDVWTGTSGVRFTTRSVGKTEDAARTMRTRTHASFEYAALVVGGVTSTPVLFESADPIAEDDGWFSGLETWTCTF